MARTLAAISAVKDPARRAQAAHHALRELDEKRLELVTLRRAAVAELRAAGWTWQEVAGLLGIHRNRAAHLLDG